MCINGTCFRCSKSKAETATCAFTLERRRLQGLPLVLEMVCASHWEVYGRSAPPVVFLWLVAMNPDALSPKKRPTSIPTFLSCDCQKFGFFLGG